MHRGFILNVDESFFHNLDLYYNKGLDSYNKNKKSISVSLDQFINKYGVINTTNLQEEWFPEIDSHIFLSHSHADEKLCIALAGWIYEKFHLKVFVDSCIWGDAKDLLEKIDIVFSKRAVSPNPDINGITHLDYDKVIVSSSHIHIMLVSALTRMIDNCECLIFLNTNKSLYISNVDSNNKTRSPWIYSEIETSKMIRKKKKSRPEQSCQSLFERGFQKTATEDLEIQMEYNLDLEHLDLLNQSILREWSKKWHEWTSTIPSYYNMGYADILNVFSLDDLYDLSIPNRVNK